MKNIYKRLLSFLAAIALVLGLVGANAAPALAATSKEKIKLSVATQTQTDQNSTAETYVAYKIFDATKINTTVGDTTSTPQATQTPTEGVSYFLDKDSPWQDIVSATAVTKYLKFTAASDGSGWTVTWNTYDEDNNSGGAVYNEASAIALADILNGYIKIEQDSSRKVKVGDNGTERALAASTENDPDYWSVTTTSDTEVPIGYYLITSSLGANLILATTDITITEKNDYPTVDKKIMQTSDETTAFDPAVSSTDAQIGDIITFTIDVKIPASANQEIKVVDIISDGLTMNTTATQSKIAGNGEPLMTVTLEKGDSTATFTAPSVDGIQEWTKASGQTYQYTTMWSEIDPNKPVKVNANGETAEVGKYTKYTQVIPADIVKAVAATATSTNPSTLTLTYKAKVNDSAALATATNGNANTNRAHIEYSNYTTPEKETEVYTHEFDLVKYYDKTEEQTTSHVLLPGAEFKLYRDTQVDSTTGKLINYASALKFTQDSGTNAYRVVDGLGEANEGSETLSSTDGKYNIEGLDAGDYYLEETKAPDGYNKLQYMIKITVSEATTESNGATTVTGTNVKASTKAEEVLSKITYTMADNASTGVATISNTTYTSGGVAVLNQAGTVLPSTGGIGTTIFYIVGGVLVLGAVALLVARRRKNA